MFKLCSNACQQLNISFNFYQEIDSTNSALLNMLRTDCTKSYVVIAGAQHKGRGRSGKHWLSPPNTNLYLSFGLALPFDQQRALSLTVACAVIAGLKSKLNNEFARQLNVKWPNDIYLNNQKLAGILLETANNLCVIGIGINVNMDNSHLANIEQTATSLKIATRLNYDLDEVACALITSLHNYINLHIKHGFSYFKELWHKYHIWQNLPVKIILSDNQIYGIARGVTNAGELILDTTNGRQFIISGDVSLRRA